MNQILVHVGIHKTGTTWMQNELFIENSEAYAPLYNENTLNGHSTLAEDFIFDFERNLLSPFDLNTEHILKSYKTILSKKDIGNKVLVMSHERLSGHPSCSGFDASVICDRIEKVFPKAKILIVIREQISCIASNYFQYLKEGGVLNIKKYLDYTYDGRRPGCGLNYFKYHNMVTYYMDKFGKENVLVQPYELFQLDKKQFLINLTKFTNHSIDLSKINTSKMHNFKSTHFTDYYFRFLNNYTKSSSSFNSAQHTKTYQKKKMALMIKGFLNIFNSKSLNASVKNKVTKEVESWTNKKFEASNRLTTSLTNLDLESLGYLVEK